MLLVMDYLSKYLCLDICPQTKPVIIFEEQIMSKDKLSAGALLLSERIFAPSGGRRVYYPSNSFFAIRTVLKIEENRLYIP